MQVPQLNLLLAWLWVVLGLISGAVLGLNFHREDWLGGYASLRRRLYRLGHISFFGLALINLMFYFTARTMAPTTTALDVASWGFLIGALTMPVCCLVTAHWPRGRAFFVVPVASLITGGLTTLWEVAKL